MAAQNSGPNEQVRSRVQEPGRVSEAVESPFMASMQDDSAVNRHSTDFYTRPSVSSARHSVSKRQSVVAGHSSCPNSPISLQLPSHRLQFMIHRRCHSQTSAPAALRASLRCLASLPSPLLRAIPCTRLRTPVRRTWNLLQGGGGRHYP